MVTGTFAENSESLTGSITFLHLKQAYNRANNAERENRPDFISDYLFELDMLKKFNCTKISGRILSETAEMTTKISTWAKRGENRKRAIEGVQSMFVYLADKPEYCEILNSCAKIMVGNNKPSAVGFFRDYLDGKEIPRPTADLKFEHLTP